jgi:hypothetical protein
MGLQQRKQKAGIPGSSVSDVGTSSSGLDTRCLIDAKLTRELLSDSRQFGSDLSSVFFSNELTSCGRSCWEVEGRSCWDGFLGIFNETALLGCAALASLTMCTPASATF